MDSNMPFFVVEKRQSCDETSGLWIGDQCRAISINHVGYGHSYLAEIHPSNSLTVQRIFPS